MSRRWTIFLLALVELVGLVGCSSAPTVGAAGSTDSAGPDQSTSTTSGPPGTSIGLYFLRDGKVGAGQRQIAVTDDPPHTSIDLLLKGPTDVDKAAGLTTALRPTVQLRSLTVADGVATADFSRDLEDRDTQPSVAQIVYTLTQFPSVTKVKLLIDGLPNGAAGVLPYTRNDVPRITPDLLLESPSPGLASPAGVKVSGEIGMTFPSFGYRFDAGGQTIAQGTITTKFGTGPRKKFDQVVGLPAGTTGPVVMAVSPPPGSAQAPFSVAFSVG
jgi:hypothetical protein